MNTLTDTDLQFIIVIGQYFGLLLALACIIMGVLIGVGTAQKMRGGWTVWESLKQSLREWP